MIRQRCVTIVHIICGNKNNVGSFNTTVTVYMPQMSSPVTSITPIPSSRKEAEAASTEFLAQLTVVPDGGIPEGISTGRLPSGRDLLSRLPTSRTAGRRTGAAETAVVNGGVVNNKMGSRGDNRGGSFAVFFSQNTHIDETRYELLASFISQY